MLTGKKMAIRYQFKGYKRTDFLQKDFQKKVVIANRNIPLDDIAGRIYFQKQGPIHQVFCQLSTKDGKKLQLETTASSQGVCVDKIIYKLSSYFIMHQKRNS